MSEHNKKELERINDLISFGWQVYSYKLHPNKLWSKHKPGAEIVLTKENVKQHYFFFEAPSHNDIIEPLTLMLEAELKYKEANK